MNRVVFVPCARVDQGAVGPAAELLWASGVEVFVDVLSMGFAERWNDVLQHALQQCERVLVFWSRGAAASGTLPGGSFDAMVDHAALFLLIGLACIALAAIALQIRRSRLAAGRPAERWSADVIDKVFAA